MLRNKYEHYWNTSWKLIKPSYMDPTGYALLFSVQCSTNECCYLSLFGWIENNRGNVLFLIKPKFTSWAAYVSSEVQYPASNYGVLRVSNLAYSNLIIHLCLWDTNFSIPESTLCILNSIGHLMLHAQVIYSFVPIYFLCCRTFHKNVDVLTLFAFDSWW